MAVSVFDDRVFGALFGDAELADIFGPQAMVARFNTVEAALTRAAADVGLIPADAARAILQLLDGFEPDWTALADGTRADGMPVPRYVAALKAAAGDTARWVHLGSTSQDIMDTSQALALRTVSDALAPRIEAVGAAIDALERSHGANALMGRTRMQAALPLTVADRLRVWRQPLAAAATALPAVRERVEVLQSGGPVGTRRGWDGKGGAIAEHMADALGLADPGSAWHTARGGLGAYAGWLTEVSAALGKIGADVCLMSQQGVDEIALSGGGASSAMAHKANPVEAELLLTLARFCAGSLGLFGQALVHEQERSGVAWTLEWMVLPQMGVAAGTGLATAERLLARVERIGAPG